MNVWLWLALCLAYQANEIDEVIQNASYCQVIFNNVRGQRSSFLVWRNPDSIHYHKANLNMVFYSKKIREALARNRVAVSYYNGDIRELECHVYEHLDEKTERMVAQKLDQDAALPEIFYSWIEGKRHEKKQIEDAEYRWCNLF